MRAQPGSDPVKKDRRELLNTAAMGIATAGAPRSFAPPLESVATIDAVRPFRINVPEADLVDLIPIRLNIDT